LDRYGGVEIWEKALWRESITAPLGTIGGGQSLVRVPEVPEVLYKADARRLGA